MRILRILIFAPLFLFVFQSNAQEESNSLDSGTISSQFQYLEKKSGNYRANNVRYEVIKLFELQKLKQNILDSLNANNVNIAELKATIAKNETEIASLKSQLQETSDNLKTITEEKDSVSFFGALISKNTYKAIMWILVFVLLLLLLLFIYKFRNSNFLTQQAKASLADLEQEYEQHRRRALEREQKISRELQDVLNKNKKSI
ncbi:tRNA (guanine-N1)-methyltransferase [Allomuricauda sp. d1]|uniref:tRNA (guanine-N1)-methyltransferase n=1 Tax=Allomuricauda sp. d1 TaxID=3136725 RepID=UPI0031DE6CA9